MKKAVKTRVGIKHIKPSKRRFKPFAGPPGYCRIARDVDLDVSTSMMCGVSEFKDIRIPWTILYDEYFYGISGTLTIRVGRKAYHIKPGDGLWLPEGTKLVYEAKGKARVMFAVWPVDYKKRHGLE